MEGESLPSSLEPHAFLSEVVETPGCIIAMPGERMIYIKSIALNYTLLVEVIRQGGEWVVIRGQRNPSQAILEPLLREGILIPGCSIHQAL